MRRKSQKDKKVGDVYMARRHRMNNSYNISTLFCTECGFPMYVPRSAGSCREMNHTKHMFCPNCKGLTAHREVRTVDIIYPQEYYVHKLFMQYNSDGINLTISFSGIYFLNDIPYLQVFFESDEYSAIFDLFSKREVQEPIKAFKKSFLKKFKVLLKWLYDDILEASYQVTRPETLLKLSKTGYCRQNLKNFLNMP